MINNNDITTTNNFSNDNMIQQPQRRRQRRRRRQRQNHQNPMIRKIASYLTINQIRTVDSILLFLRYCFHFILNLLIYRFKHIIIILLLSLIYRNYSSSFFFKLNIIKKNSLICLENPKVCFWEVVEQGTFGSVHPVEYFMRGNEWENNIKNGKFNLLDIDDDQNNDDGEEQYQQYLRYLYTYLYTPYPNGNQQSCQSTTQFSPSSTFSLNLIPKSSSIFEYPQTFKDTITDFRTSISKTNLNYTVNSHRDELDVSIPISNLLTTLNHLENLTKDLQNQYESYLDIWNRGSNQLSTTYSSSAKNILASLSSFEKSIRARKRISRLGFLQHLKVLITSYRHQRVAWKEVEGMKKIHYQQIGIAKKEMERIVIEGRSVKKLIQRVQVQVKIIEKNALFLQAQISKIIEKFPSDILMMIYTLIDSGARNRGKKEAELNERLVRTILENTKRMEEEIGWKVLELEGLIREWSLFGGKEKMKCFWPGVPVGRVGKGSGWGSVEYQWGDEVIKDWIEQVKGWCIGKGVLVDGIEKGVNMFQKMIEGSD